MLHLYETNLSLDNDKGINRLRPLEFLPSGDENVPVATVMTRCDARKMSDAEALAVISPPPINSSMHTRWYLFYISQQIVRYNTGMYYFYKGVYVVQRIIVYKISLFDPFP